jgi:hypothetical protein
VRGRRPRARAVAAHGSWRAALRRGPGVARAGAAEREQAWRLAGQARLAQAMPGSGGGERLLAALEQHATHVQLGRCGRSVGA